jgi:hypothetical protein
MEFTFAVDRRGSRRKRGDGNEEKKKWDMGMAGLAAMMLMQSIRKLLCIA